MAWYWGWPSVCTYLEVTNYINYLHLHCNFMRFYKMLSNFFLASLPLKHFLMRWPYKDFKMQLKAQFSGFEPQNKTGMNNKVSIYAVK